MLYLIRNKFLSLADSIDTKFTCEQEPRFPPGNHSWSDESSSSSTSYDPFPDHDDENSSKPNCLYTYSFHIQYIQCLILASGYPQEPQRPFWMWKARRLHLLQIVWVLVCFLPKEEVPLVYAHGYSRFSQFQHHPFSILLLSFNNILSCPNHYSPFRY